MASEILLLPFFSSFLSNFQTSLAEPAAEAKTLFELKLASIG